MKKTHKSLMATAGILAALMMNVQAQTTWIGGATDDFAIGTNWDNGLPTAPANLGTLSSTAEWDSANQTLTDYYVDIVTGGNLTRNDFFTPQTISGGVWTINGGSISNMTQFNVTGDAQVTLNTGAITTGGGRDLFLTGTSVFTVAGGTLTLGDQLSLDGGTFTMNGGTTAIGGTAGSNFGSNGTVNFNAGSFTAANWGVDLGTIGARTINFGSGNGTVDFTSNFEARNTTINWVSGSGMSLTFGGSLLNSGSATTFESLYSGGQLLYESANTDPFSSVFQVSGNTLTLIPEPSTFALLGVAGLALALLRRRRS